MRIAVVVDHDIELLNGASLQSRQFVDWLVRHGHEVALIFPSRHRSKSASSPGIRYFSIPAFSVPSYPEYCVPLPFLAVSLWPRHWQIDLVHAETINPTMLLLGYWMSRRRVPVFNVLTANVPFYSPLLLPGETAVKKLVFRCGKALMNRIANKIAGTFVLSDGMKTALTQDFYSIRQEKVFLFLRPLGAARFLERSKPEKIFDPFSVPKGSRISTLSRLCRTKNVDFLIRTFALHIYPQNKSLHFFVAGHGPLEAELKSLANTLDCPNIHFLGRIPCEAVPAFLGESDFFFYASLSETFGNVVCEAKCAGVPVIALDDHGGIRAQIEDKRTGILIEEPKEEMFARRFFELHSDRGLQAELRKNGRLDVLLNNSPDKVYGNLIRIYEKAIRREPLDAGEISPLFSYDRSFIEARHRQARADGEPSKVPKDSLTLLDKNIPV